LLKRDLFIKDGAAASDEVEAAYARLAEIQASAASEFPMSNSEVMDMRERLAEHVNKVAGIEREAVDLLQAAMV
jgi:hypothetical protein